MRGKNRIIFPLDFQDLDLALDWVDLIKDHVGMFKVGLELFLKYGSKSVEKIKERTKLPIFLDLKLCDIPNTVHQAVKSVLSLEVDFLTVHVLSGAMALRSAVQASEARVAILGVTLLTSLDRADLLELGFSGELIRESEELVLRYALIAQRCGCVGVIASGKEVRRLKETLPSLLVFVPGIRREPQEVHDQLRTSTPKEAILNGADYLVVGRPIRLSEDPVNVCRLIAQEIEEAESMRNA